MPAQSFYGISTWVVLVEMTLTLSSGIVQAFIIVGISVVAVAAVLSLSISYSREGRFNGYSFIATFGIMILVLGGIVIGIFASSYYVALRNPTQIVFAGKVINSETNEWPNDRLVLVYLNGKEIGRAISATGEFSENGMGVQDGVFTIPVTNTYILTPDTFKVEQSASQMSGVNTEGLYTWLELEEGGQIKIPVPTKNLIYIVKSIAGDTATLPPELLANKSTRLSKTNEIIVSLPTSNPNEIQNAIVANIPNMAGIQFTDITTETVNLNKITVPLNNCSGSSSLSQDFTQTQTFIHEYHAEASGKAGVELRLPIPVIWPRVILELQAKYGFEQGQVDARTIAYHMEAQASTNQTYVLTWKEVWQAGTVQTTAENDKITIPYKVRTDLIYEVDSKKLGC